VEASEAFSKDLLTSLLQLKDRATAPVWTTAEKLFHEKVAGEFKSYFWMKINLMN